jgi:hypothetical protein
LQRRRLGYGLNPNPLTPIPLASKSAGAGNNFDFRKSHIRCESPRARSCRLAAGQHFGNGELSIWAVWNHVLTRLKMKLFAIELHRNNVRLE